MLTVDALLVGLVCCIRMPLVLLYFNEGGAALYDAFYGLPLHALFHFAMGGVCYYVYPYITIIVTLVLLTILMNGPAATGTTLVATFKAEGSSLAIFILVSILLMFGVASSGIYFHPGDASSALFVLSPIVPILLFSGMKRVTHPDLTRRLMPKRTIM